jgi:hypothetical protein
MTRYIPMILAAISPMAMFGDDQTITRRFQAMVGREKFACGKTYEGIGTTRSRIMPRDFRL